MISASVAYRIYRIYLIYRTYFDDLTGSYVTYKYVVLYWSDFLRDLIEFLGSSSGWSNKILCMHYPGKMRGHINSWDTSFLSNTSFHNFLQNLQLKICQNPVYPTSSHHTRIIRSQLHNQLTAHPRLPRAICVSHTLRTLTRSTFWRRFSNKEYTYSVCAAAASCGRCVYGRRGFSGGFPVIIEFGWWRFRRAFCIRCFRTARENCHKTATAFDVGRAATYARVNMLI